MKLKFLRILKMFTRYSLYVFVIQFLFMSSVLASAASGQYKSIREVNIQLGFEQEELGQVFEKIQGVTEFSFFYEQGKGIKEKYVTILPATRTVADLLYEVARQTGLKFRQVNNTISVGIIDDSKRKTPSQDELVRVEITISGKVTNQNGESLPGVNIVIKGTSRGSLTDLDGNYRIEAAAGEVLVFSFIGYKTFEVVASNNPVINVVMEEEATSLQEVVVTGLFERSEQTFTGAAMTITQEELQTVDNDDLLGTIQMLEPSFQLRENISLGSNPNALPEVVIRGGNSLADLGASNSGDIFGYTSNPNVPLFILNGFEVTLQRINDLNMNLVKNVTILRDAAATALYGSRAANGIVVIETIVPKGGDLRVNYTGSVTVETPDLNSYDLLNAEEKLELEQAGGIYNNLFPFQRENLDYLYNQRLAAARSGVDTDWLRIPLRNSIGTQQNIYMDGGSQDKVMYGIGLNYQHTNGVMKESSRKNISANSYLSYRVKDLQFRNEFIVTFNKGTNSPYGSFGDYARMNPYWAPYDASGNVKYFLENVTSPNDYFVNSQVNPVYNTTLNTVDETSYKNFSNNFVTEWKAMDWLRFTGRFSYQLQNNESDNFKPAQHTDFVDIPLERFYERGEYIKGYGRMSRLDGSLIANVNKAFDNHIIYGSVGMNLLETKFTQEEFTVQGFPNARLDQLLAGNRFPENQGPSGSESISRTAGYFVNAGYSFDNRYFVDVSYRLDGSSQFGRDRRFAPFWSVGAGWNIHEESFLDNSDYIDRLKIRYSYGYTGSQNFPSYMGITTSGYYTDQHYRYNLGTYLLGYGNERLRWQRTVKRNLGADIELLNSNVSLTVDYFVERTEGSVTRVTTAPSTGFVSYNENIGDVVNKGWELKSRFFIYNDPRSRNQISAFFNAIHVKGTIEKISNSLEEINEQNSSELSTDPLPRYVEGRSTTAIWAVPSLGIDPSTGREIYLARDGSYTSVYNPADQIVAGDSRSELEGSFGPTMEYNGIGLNLFFSFRYGGHTYNQTLVDRVEGADLNFNVDRRVYEGRWREPGDETFFKGVVDPDGYTITSTTYASSRFVQDYNWLSLTNASLYYRFSERLNNKLGLQNTKITLFTGDVFFLSTVRRERGLDYPFSRSFTLQLQTSF